MFGFAAIGRALDAVAKRWLQRGKETDRQRRLSYDRRHQAKTEKYEAQKEREREETERAKQIRELCDTAVRAIYAALPAEKELSDRLIHEGAKLHLELKKHGEEVNSRDITLWVLGEREKADSPEYDEALVPVREALLTLSPYLLIQWGREKYPMESDLLGWIQRIKLFRESIPVLGVGSSLLDQG
ncbi:hypothetical protein [Streptomyces malaysiensis]|uniref:Uncharacterized protein n=1 Tax=Streptomyces malaysiensis subsp. samsunensis TaxID=459658 RepID=A0A9X2LUR1_STRMQ|nr:hypothetical protein [Streptomyces samsunensis]MCQ8829853.1 hypothetical protein [Streptomyces samsunensis]